jgi:hypothetical protein
MSKKWILHEEGEPNRFSIIDDGKGLRQKWFMVMKFSGQTTTEQQRILANAMLDMINDLDLE